MGDLFFEIEELAEPVIFLFKLGHLDLFLLKLRHAAREFAVASVKIPEPGDALTRVTDCSGQGLTRLKKGLKEGQTDSMKEFGAFRRLKRQKKRGEGEKKKIDGALAAHA